MATEHSGLNTCILGIPIKENNNFNRLYAVKPNEFDTTTKDIFFQWLKKMDIFWEKN